LLFFPPPGRSRVFFFGLFPWGDEKDDPPPFSQVFCFIVCFFGRRCAKFPPLFFLFFLCCDGPSPFFLLWSVNVPQVPNEWVVVLGAFWRSLFSPVWVRGASMFCFYFPCCGRPPFFCFRVFFARVCFLYPALTGDQAFRLVCGAGSDVFV